MHGFSLEGFTPAFDPAAEVDKYSYLAKERKVEQLTYILGEEDPREVIMRRLADVLDHLPPLNASRVLVVTAPTPIKRSSILHTQGSRDKKVDEARFQGKVGLIIKVGPTAFRYDPRYPRYSWEGPKQGVGDWVFYRTSDSSEVGLGVSDGIAISGRIIWDDNIMGGPIQDIESIY